MFGNVTSTSARWIHGRETFQVCSPRETYGGVCGYFFFESATRNIFDPHQQGWILPVWTKEGITIPENLAQSFTKSNKTRTQINTEGSSVFLKAIRAYGPRGSG